MKTLITFLFASTFLFSACANGNTDVSIPQDADQPMDFTMDDLANDTTKMLEASLPFSFDSTRMLIQPLGLVAVNKGKLESKASSSKYKGGYMDDYYVSGFNGTNTITGRMMNVYFDDVDNQTQRLLTDKALSITNITYLRQLTYETHKDYLIYMVYDKDTNNDGRLNAQDLLTLYISKLDGSGFEKITPDNELFDEGKLVAWSKRYYFNTAEDINKNPKLDKKIKKHYYYIDFAGDGYKVVKYNPFGN